MNELVMIDSDLLDTATGGAAKRGKDPLVVVGDGKLVPASQVDDLVCGAGWAMRNGGCHKL